MNHGMIYDKNVELLIEYFESGCKKEQLIGVELEHFVLDRETRESITYEGGVEKILQCVQPLIGEAVYSQGRIIGISGADYEISLEPAAQLEISIKPSSGLEEIRNTYDAFIEIISPILDESGYELFCAGYQPISEAEILPLIPKQKYELMNEYFKTTGTCGTRMMRGTASTQINIDYENETDFIKKFRVANILSPIFSFMCDTTGEMTRTHIWNNVDPVRSAIVKNALNLEDFGFEDYAKYIMDLPPIFLMQNMISTESKPVSELFAGRLLTHEDIEHITSMAFPDVRLKKYLEIRMADSMPIDDVLNFSAIVQNIFYDAAALEKFYNDTLKIKNHHVAEAKAALIKHGENAKIYGKPASEWRLELIPPAR
jgi:glutamate--cysteine ligase